MEGRQKMKIESRMKSMTWEKKVALAATEKDIMEALDHSIEHWKENKNGKGECSFSASSCELCTYCLGFDNECKRCPIFILMDMNGCDKTPWRSMEKHVTGKHGKEGLDFRTFNRKCPTCLKIAVKEYDFLVELREIIKLAKTEIRKKAAHKRLVEKERLQRVRVAALKREAK